MLRKHPGEYTKQPKCANCGARDWRPDRWMNQRNNKRQTCHADCYSFPHRIGSAGCKFLTHGVYKQ